MPDRFTDNSDEGSGRGDTALEGTDGTWWDGFFSDRSKGVPFFTGQPDENLAEWFASGLLVPGRVLEFGCGNGRNAVYLASLGCTVDAVDFSDEAVSWARERASQADVQVAFQCCSVFDAQFTAGAYDLVYDSGCFHHLPPRRRQEYSGLVAQALRPGGSYGLVCFRPEGGSGYTDEQVYQRGSLGGGLGYSEQALRSLWDKPPFAVRVLRQMKQADTDESRFGLDFLWTLLATRQAKP